MEDAPPLPRCPHAHSREWQLQFPGRFETVALVQPAVVAFDQFGVHEPYGTFVANLQLLDHLPPALWRNTVIYTSGDAVVRAFNSRNGREAWRHTFLYPTSSAPTVAGDRVYFGVRGDGVPGT